jgi:hypothetical protein
MKIEEYTSWRDRSKSITVTFTETELNTVPLEDSDLPLLRECSDSDKVSDKLRVLTLIAERLEENESKSSD